jgi:hypothetical protein
VADGVGQMEQFSEYGVDAAKWPCWWEMVDGFEWKAMEMVDLWVYNP